MKNPVFDKDLTTLLRGCTNDDLDPIVDIILAAPSQTLTVKRDYREHQGDHKAYIDEIVYEITSFGGNTLANLVRGHGVPYSEMVRDVASHLGIKPTVVDTVERLEEKVILKLLRLAYDRLDSDDKVALADLMNAGAAEGEEIDFGEGFPEEEISQRLADTASSLMGDRLQNAVDLAARSSRIRSTIMSTTKAVVTKVATASLGGPLSWAAAIGESVYELFGPSHSTAISLVAHIGLLRQKYDRIGEEEMEEMMNVS